MCAIIPGISDGVNLMRRSNFSSINLPTVQLQHHHIWYISNILLRTICQTLIQNAYAVSEWTSFTSFYVRVQLNRSAVDAKVLTPLTSIFPIAFLRIRIILSFLFRTLQICVRFELCFPTKSGWYFQFIVNLIFPREKVRFIITMLKRFFLI